MKGQNLKAKTPAEYLAALTEPRRAEIVALDAVIRKALPKLEPFVHDGMLAYGPIRMRYASGREADWFRVGIADNKAAISLYCCGADADGWVAERYRALLPKAKIGKSCVRFKRLADLDAKVLVKLLKETAKAGFGEWEIR